MLYLDFQVPQKTPSPLHIRFSPFLETLNIFPPYRLLFKVAVFPKLIKSMLKIFENKYFLF